MGTPSKWYKWYYKRISKEDEHNALIVRKNADIRELKTENCRLKNEMEAFIQSISKGCYYREDAPFTDVIGMRIYIGSDVKQQIMGNENFCRHLIRYHAERAVRDIMIGVCDD